MLDLEAVRVRVRELLDDGLDAAEEDLVAEAVPEQARVRLAPHPGPRHRDPAFGADDLDLRVRIRIVETERADAAPALREAEDGGDGRVYSLARADVLSRDHRRGLGGEERPAHVRRVAAHVPGDAAGHVGVEADVVVVVVLPEAEPDADDPRVTDGPVGKQLERAHP